VNAKETKTVGKNNLNTERHKDRKRTNNIKWKKIDIKERTNVVVKNIDG
jgi:hypothetical protein